MTENERTMMLAETTVDIIAMLEERIGPSDDELAVLSSVISYILCNHLSLSLIHISEPTRPY